MHDICHLYAVTRFFKMVLLLPFYHRVKIIGIGTHPAGTACGDPLCCAKRVGNNFSMSCSAKRVGNNFSTPCYPKRVENDFPPLCAAERGDERS